MAIIWLCSSFDVLLRTYDKKYFISYMLPSSFLCFLYLVFVLFLWFLLPLKLLSFLLCNWNGYYFNLHESFSIISSFSQLTMLYVELINVKSKWVRYFNWQNHFFLIQDTREDHCLTKWWRMPPNVKYIWQLHFFLLLYRIFFQVPVLIYLWEF